MRHTKDVVIAAEGRDKGKRFLITEMSATQAEKWAARALLALGRGGFEYSAELRSVGMSAIAVAGLGALLRTHYEDVEPLLDEMMACVQIYPDPKASFTRALYPDDIEEVYTLAILRSEVFELHTGFSVAGALSNSEAPAETTDPNSDGTLTFRSQ